MQRISYPRTVVCKLCNNAYTYKTVNHYHFVYDNNGKCPFCADSSQYSTRLMVRKQIEAKYGDKLSIVSPIETPLNKLVINCNRHGTLQLSDIYSLQYNGCPKCTLEDHRVTQQEFVDRAMAIHGNKYDYSQANYIDMRTCVTIICPTHGPFKQRAVNHVLHKHGCKKCSVSSSRSEHDFLNYIGIEQTHRQVKELNYLIDGVIGNKAYEFLGDLWHGHPSYIGKKSMSPKGLTIEQRQQKTHSKFTVLTNVGYTVNYCWEFNWNRFKTGETKEPIVYTFDGTLRF